MQEARARFGLKLRTGFFRTELYTVEVTGTELRFIPSGRERGGRGFSFPVGGIRMAVLLPGRPPELEIRTESEMLTGSFTDPTELPAATAALHVVLGARFWEGDPRM